MADFIHDFMTGVHGHELDSSRYRCTDRIADIGQKILAIALSPDGRMYAYGGECMIPLVVESLETITQES